MENLTTLRSTIAEALNNAVEIHDVTISVVGNDLSVHFRLPDAALSSFEVRNQFSRGLSTESKYELVNASLLVPAPEDFDEDNPFESADTYAKELYNTVEFMGHVSPPASAAAPDMDEGRMISIPHNNHGSDVEAYLSWVLAVAEYVQS